MSDIRWLSSRDPAEAFPNPANALSEPNGLLAVGGDLAPERLTAAYVHGIFPWYEEGQPVLWWSPDPRAVLFPHQLKVSRSLRKTINKETFETTSDQAFAEVISACAAWRPDSGGTWITRAMADAYRELHDLGYAHSVECWRDGSLAGGLYGIAIGQVFFGESMFSRETDASKVALVWLIEHLVASDYRLVDCQVPSGHLASLGSCNIPREEFLQLLDDLCPPLIKPGSWQLNMSSA